MRSIAEIRAALDAVVVTNPMLAEMVDAARRMRLVPPTPDEYDGEGGPTYSMADWRRSCRLSDIEFSVAWEHLKRSGVDLLNIGRPRARLVSL